MKKQKDIEDDLEKKYGKLIVKSFAQYYGGYRPKIAGGIMSPLNVGMLYLFKTHFVFQADVANHGNYWEIVIPINAIVTESWIPDDETDLDDPLLEGIDILEDVEKKKRLVIPFIDDDGILHKPEFGITKVPASKKSVGAASYFGGGGLKNIVKDLYVVVVENHRNKLQLQASISDENIQETKNLQEKISREDKILKIVQDTHVLVEKNNILLSNILSLVTKMYNDGELDKDTFNKLDDFLKVYYDNPFGVD